MCCSGFSLSVDRGIPPCLLALALFGAAEVEASGGRSRGPARREERQNSSLRTRILREWWDADFAARLFGVWLGRLFFAR